MTPPRLRQEMAQGGTGAAERSGEGDVEHGRPLLVGHLDEGHRAAESGVVHGHVDAAESRHGAVVERVHLRLVGDVAGDGVDPFGAVPRPSASCSAVSARRRSWASETMTAAPSSRQRRAVAEPIPVPAAAVTTTTLPSSSPWPVGGGAAEVGRRSNAAI